MMQNLGALVLESAETFEDDVAFQVRRGFRLERLTFRQVGEHSRRVAGWLVAKGLVSGDRVVVWSPNMPEYAVLYFGAWLAGVVVVPIDVRTTLDVRDRFVAAAAPRLGFMSRSLAGTFPSPVQETIALEELFDRVADVPPLTTLPAVGPDNLCEIAFTSGTTASPKGVMLTHGNFLAENAALRRAFPLQRSYRALSLLPLSHSLEQSINLLLAYTSGVRMTYVPRVNALTITRALRDDEITCLVIVPELLRLLLTRIERQAQQQGRWRQYQLAHRVAGRLPLSLRRLLFYQVHRALGGHLTFFGCGGAPLDPQLAAAWERMGIEVFEGYGLTETAGAALLNTRSAKRPGSVGKPLPGIAVRIADDGEILLRGAAVSPGYFDNPEQTARAFADGWLRSGDVGSIDAEGFVWVSGRQAFKLVLADGRNVYPEDIERVLNEHPLVTESCVVGRRRHGADVVHAVVLTSAPERADVIMRETNRRLEAQQQIRGITAWPEEDFPRTPTLKINRALVQAAVEREETAAEREEVRPTAARPAEERRATDPLVDLVARVASVPAAQVRDEHELGSDLGLDSLGRVEVVAAIEEELGRVIDEGAVGPQTTVGELRRLAEAGTAGETGVARARWTRSPWARVVRRGLQRALFSIQDFFVRLEVVHPERLAALPLPAIVIFNYQGPYAALAVLRVLPPLLRSRVAIAADARLWQGRDRWQGLLGALAVQAFPFAKSGGGVRAGLEEMGRLLDEGCAVIISPEGNPEPDGEVLPFLAGTGLMAVEMGVPVVPCKLDGYYLLFPRQQTFPFLPSRRGRARLIIGEPVRFPAGMPYQEATERARQALIATR